LVTGIGLGEADLAADLLVDRDEGLVWARGAVVAAARAAGLPSPVQSVWTDVGDPDGLRVSSEIGRATGFFGRSVIHPRQIDTVHDVYTPSAEEVRAAEGVVATATEAAARGEAAALDPNGRFVDPAVVARARTILDRAGGRGRLVPSAPDPRPGEAQ
jgi:citrate lyase subunit beta/citryl-CoA lyase